MATVDIDISITNVWRAWQAFCSGKRPSEAIVLFRSKLESNLLKLTSDLQKGEYRPGGYESFIVHDPKRREIAVASVRDRIVHRLLYDYLVQVWDKLFAYGVWSCRKNKGLKLGIEHAQVNMNKYKNGWIWRSDISKFFDNVEHEKLKFILGCRTDDKVVINLLNKVIDSYSLHSKQASKQASKQGSAYRQLDEPDIRQYLSKRVRSICTAHIKTTRLQQIR